MCIKNIRFKPIGIIHSEHKVLNKIPAQPIFAKDCTGKVEIFPEYSEGLKDLEGFSHIYLLPYLDKCGEVNLIVKPYLQNNERGLFATRYPCRPNSIGLSIVELIKREDNILHISGLDILDGTLLLDLKPYSTRFDNVNTSKNSWQDKVDDKSAQTLGLRDYKGNK